ncbi:MAG: ADP-ribose pyrophosphatase [Candidatus Cloacimonadota bacterium]|nr:MAG: ADP-ribose pyrophosphatase [Candidatus Cloacimonadota bacterium]PIE77749.1 MAG: ADP-ribose pyrophosphatase [Candidatus Delongbacteria bacterium]
MKILSKREVLRGDFTSYCETSFLNKLGKEEKWEYLKRNNGCKAVIINVVNRETIILVKQFRFPLCKFILEFPAGLIDEGESIEDAAKRELLEETGYRGEVLSVSPPVSSSPGITNETIYFANMEIFGNKGEQKLDDVEEIEVIEFNRANFKEEIREYLSKNSDTIVDSKVWSKYCL